MSDDVVMLEVIRTRLTVLGEGTVGNPTRVVTEYWAKDGTLLARVDPQGPITPEMQQRIVAGFTKAIGQKTKEHPCLSPQLCGELLSVLLDSLSTTT